MWSSAGRSRSRVVKSGVGGGGRRRTGPAIELPKEHSVLAARYRVVRWHGKERRSRLLPLNIRQRVARIAKPRIAPLAHHHPLPIIGVPLLGHDGNRFFIPTFSRGSSLRDGPPLRAHSRNRVPA